MFAGVNGNPRTQYANSYRFLPRFGATYQVNRRVKARRGARLAAAGPARRAAEGNREQERGRRGRSERTMRSLQLEAALTEFVAAAADRLQAEIDAGAEVGFELTEKPARRGEGATRLYCYRALTGAFIEQRAAQLASLPAHAEATRNASVAPRR